MVDDQVAQVRRLAKEEQAASAARAAADAKFRSAKDVESQRLKGINQDIASQTAALNTSAARLSAARAAGKALGQEIAQLRSKFDSAAKGIPSLEVQFQQAQRGHDELLKNVAERRRLLKTLSDQDRAALAFFGGLESRASATIPGMSGVVSDAKREVLDQLQDVLRLEKQSGGRAKARAADLRLAMQDTVSAHVDLVLESMVKSGTLTPTKASQWSPRMSGAILAAMRDAQASTGQFVGLDDIISVLHRPGANTSDSEAARRIATAATGVDDARVALASQKAVAAAAKQEFENAINTRAPVVALEKADATAAAGIAAAALNILRTQQGPSSVFQSAEDEARLAAQHEDVAKRNLTAAKETLEARRTEAAAIRDTRDVIKQHLWGAIFDMQMKVMAMVGYIRALGRVLADAAKFHFEATGLTAMLDKTRGAGEDLYGQYARLAKYQGEVSPTESLSRMTELAAAGYGETEIPRGVEAIFNTMLAARGEITTGGATDFGVSLHRAFGTAGRDMTELLDTAVAAANKFPMTLGKIRDAMGYATEAAVQTNQSLEETLISIGLLMPITKTASKAGTVFRGGTLSMVKPKGQQLLADIGVNPTTPEGAMRPILDTMLEVNRAMERVQQVDLAGTWQSPADKAESQARGKLQDIRDQQERNNIMTALSKGGMDTGQLEAIKLRIQAMEAKGEIREVEALRKEYISELNLKRQELEFQLTGQRGGAWFAAIQRIQELAVPALRGTYYETKPGEMPAVFKTAEDALAALRLGLQSTTGEARRMADSLRKTSHMLGQSFDVSLEKFRISAGTFLLPIRDSLLGVMKATIEGVTDWLNLNASPEDKYGQPGGRPAGSSVGWNLIGAAGLGATALITASAGAAMLRTLLFAKSLFSNERLQKINGLLSQGMSLGQAVAASGAPTAPGFATRMYMRARGMDPKDEQSALQAGAAVGGFTSKLMSGIGIVSTVIGGLSLFSGALTASVRAISDYTDAVESMSQKQVGKGLAGVELALRLLAEGKAKLGPDGNIVVPASERKAVVAGGSYAATGLKYLLEGGDPLKFIEASRARMRKEVEGSFSSDKELQATKLKEFDLAFQNKRTDSYTGLLHLLGQRLLQSGMSTEDPRYVDLLTLMNQGVAQRILEDDTRVTPENYAGGTAEYLLGSKLRQAGVGSVSEYQSRAGYFDRVETQWQLRAAIKDRLDKEDPGFFSQLFRSARLYAGSAFDVLAEASPLEPLLRESPLQMPEFRGITASQFDEQGRFIPGLPKIDPGAAAPVRVAEEFMKVLKAAELVKASGYLATAAQMMKDANEKLLLAIPEMKATFGGPGTTLNQPPQLP